MSKEIATAGANLAIKKTEVTAVVMLGVVAILSTITAGFSLFFIDSRAVGAVYVDKDNRVIQEIALSKPYVTEAQVIDRVSQCVVKTWVHSGGTFRYTVPLMEDCYTDVGPVIEVLSPHLKEIEKRQMILTMSVTKPYTITAKGFLEKGVFFEGEYQWRIQGEIQLSKVGVNVYDQPKAYTILLLAVRVPLKEDPRGFRIRNFQLSPVSH